MLPVSEIQRIKRTVDARWRVAALDRLTEQVGRVRHDARASPTSLEVRDGRVVVQQQDR